MSASAHEPTLAVPHLYVDHHHVEAMAVFTPNEVIANGVAVTMTGTRIGGTPGYVTVFIPMSTLSSLMDACASEHARLIVDDDDA